MGSICKEKLFLMTALIILIASTCFSEDKPVKKIKEEIHTLNKLKRQFDLVEKRFRNSQFGKLRLGKIRYSPFGRPRFGKRITNFDRFDDFQELIIK